MVSLNSYFTPQENQSVYSFLRNYAPDLNTKYYYVHVSLMPNVVPMQHVHTLWVAEPLMHNCKQKWVQCILAVLKINCMHYMYMLVNMDSVIRSFGHSCA